MSERVTEPLVPIGAAQRATGLTARRIRYYEECGLIRPSRTRGNQRLYTERDIDRLLAIKRSIDDGLPIEAIRRSLDRTGTETPQPTADEAENLSDAEQWFGHQTGPQLLYPAPGPDRLVRWLNQEDAP